LRFLVELESRTSRTLYATPPTRPIKLHANYWRNISINLRSSTSCATSIACSCRTWITHIACSICYTPHTFLWNLHFISVLANGQYRPDERYTITYSRSLRSEISSIVLI
jgi:hypothetical protein